MCSTPANRHAFRAQYEVSDDQDSVQMLQRSSQIGEFYRMSPPEVFDVQDRLPSSYMGAPLHSQDMPYTARTVLAIGAWARHLLYTAQHGAPRIRSRANRAVLFYSDSRSRSFIADIMIYDEESDRHVHITFESAVVT